VSARADALRLLVEALTMAREDGTALVFDAAGELVPSSCTTFTPEQRKVLAAHHRIVERRLRGALEVWAPTTPASAAPRRYDGGAT